MEWKKKAEKKHNDQIKIQSIICLSHDSNDKSAPIQTRIFHCFEQHTRKLNGYVEKLQIVWHWKIVQKHTIHTHILRLNVSHKTKAPEPVSEAHPKSDEKWSLLLLCEEI